jgi:CDP-6-deoxy-D-xylo-4-hexulose-3-dehydrase
MDLDKLTAAITDKTKAILSVNLLGNPNDYVRMQEIIGERDIYILEDNCESMGATLNGQQAGTFGIMGTYSSFFSHHIATMEGGCIVTDDEELYHILLCIRAHGWTRNLPKFNQVSGEKSDDPFEESFKFMLPGYNARPLEMSGALGIEQLKKLPQFIQTRQKNAQLFQQLFSDHPYITIQQETGQSSWFGFSLVLNENSPYNRAELVTKLSENGVECRPIVTGNFLKNSEVLEYFDYEVGSSMEAAEYIEEHGLFVGNHQNDIEKEIRILADILYKQD